MENTLSDNTVGLLNIQKHAQTASEAPQAKTAEKTPDVNVPLTDAQKYLMRSYQNRLNLLAKQKSEIDVQVARVEGAMQLDMMKVARENNIDPSKFGFNENLDIIPANPQPPPSMRKN